jgi:peptide deformylase
MAVRKVIFVDDERLRQKAQKITQFTPQLNQLAQDMLETMRSYHGVGLAGPQIGMMQRIFVAQIPAGRDNGQPPQPSQTYILINPQILKTSLELVEGEEGCLSIPGWQGLVARPGWVEIKAQDETGRSFKLRADNLLARIFMHELDHLNGVLYTDHIKDPDKLWQLETEEAEPAVPAEAAS